MAIRRRRKLRADEYIEVDVVVIETPTETRTEWARDCTGMR